MELEINGERRQIPDGWTIADLLVSLKVENRYCAVERNLELVPREQHRTCRLSSGDRIEIVTLVGGG
jgi:sulfur carrier protein